MIYSESCMEWCCHLLSRSVFLLSSLTRFSASSSSWVQTCWQCTKNLVCKTWVLSGVCGAPEARAASCRTTDSSRRALCRGAKVVLAYFHWPFIPFFHHLINIICIERCVLYLHVESNGSLFPGLGIYVNAWFQHSKYKHVILLTTHSYPEQLH